MIGTCLIVHKSKPKASPLLPVDNHTMLRDEGKNHEMIAANDHIVYGVGPEPPIRYDILSHRDPIKSDYSDRAESERD